jgi:hypothetical protein
MTDEPQPLSGAQFARQVGTDPEKWAQRFLDAWGPGPEGTPQGELAFVTAWFRDAMEAAVKAAVEQEWPPSD